MAKEKKKTTPKGTKVSKEFEFNLTRDEIHDMGVEMAKLDHGIGELDTQFDEVKKAWKAKIDAAEAKRKDISSVVHAKKQKRTVEAILVKDFEAKEIQYWFEDKIIESRAMTAAEAQVEMNLKEPKGAKKQKLHVVKDPVAEAHKTEEQAKQEDVAGVIAAETNRRTKSSSVDGPTTDGPGAA